MNSDTLLQHLQTYGPVVLAIVLFLASMGIPFPASIIVIAAGAFARQGRFSWEFAFFMTLLGATLGSGGSYLCGSKGVEMMTSRLKRGRAWRKAEESFEKQGAAAIVLTRFLLTPLALPINLIAGANKYPLGKFLALCTFGQAIWIGKKLALGSGAYRDLCTLDTRGGYRSVRRL